MSARFVFEFRVATDYERSDETASLRSRRAGAVFFGKHVRTGDRCTDRHRAVGGIASHRRAQHLPPLSLVFEAPLHEREHAAFRRAAAAVLSFKIFWRRAALLLRPADLSLAHLSGLRASSLVPLAVSLRLVLSAK